MLRRVSPEDILLSLFIAPRFEPFRPSKVLIVLVV